MKKSLAEILIKENLIDFKKLEKAKEKQEKYGGKLISALVYEGFIDENKMLDFLGRHFNLPTVDLNSFEINTESIKLVPQKLCERHIVIPISMISKNLVVAFADPSKLFIKDDISLLTRKKVEMVLATESSIRQAIDKNYGSSSNLLSVQSEMKKKETLDTIQAEDRDHEILQLSRVSSKEGEKKNPIISFVDTILEDAIRVRASDIHVEPYEKRFRIRFRIDGVLHEKAEPPLESLNAIISRIKVICKLNITERRHPQDGRLKVRTTGGSEIDFRVSSIPTLFGEKIVLRVLDKSNLRVDLTKLGFEKEEFEIFKRVIHQPQGMILVTGPTGSGKTTTLYSAVKDLNRSDKNVSTAEDPVEFNLDGINQVQVNPIINFHFADALRSLLRQDPEVIMVGEIRDKETAGIAYKAASTGHMVVSTLHTNDAPSTVTRLMDMGIPAYILAESTSLVLAQRLIKKICSSCIVDTKVKPEILMAAGVEEEDLDQFKDLKKGEGCNACNETGLRERVAIFELMNVNHFIKEAIFSGFSSEKIKKIAIKECNMRTLRQSALLKLKRGETSLEEVINSTLGDKLA